MTLHQFTIRIQQSEITEEAINSLAAAGCDDATVGVQNGQVSMHFDREATTQIQAIRTALDDIEKSGIELTIKSITIEK